jgi:uncharacterized membrane protein
MKESFELVEKVFFSCGEWISLILEIASVLIIVIGLISVVIFAVSNKFKSLTPLHIRVRLKFGGWLVLALEILLASDIIQTTVSPTYENLIKVGAIALIRTFLNYFLSKEIKEETEVAKELKETGKEK